MVTYINLNPDGIQALINNLTKYKGQVENSRTDVLLRNANNCHSTNGKQPTDISGFSSTLNNKCGDIQKQVDLLQSRLDSAKAANEGGITTTNPDGTISYQLPDGVDDTAANTTAIKQENKVDLVNQARKDAATLKACSQGSCSPQGYDELLSNLQKHQYDPAYSNAFLANVDPKTLLDAPLIIQNSFPEKYKTDSFGNNDTLQPPDPSVRPNAALDLATALGTILSSASGGDNWTKEKGKVYGNTLADLCQEKGHGDRAFVLNQMLLTSRSVDADGDEEEDETVGRDYNDAMLLTLAKRLENFTPEGGSSAFDDRLTKKGRSNPIAKLDPNPLAGIVHAMTGNDGVAQEWLMPHPDGVGDPNSISPEQIAERNQRIKNLTGVDRGLVGDNTWTTDWAHLARQVDRKRGLPETNDAGELEYREKAAAVTTSGILNAIGGTGEPVDISDEARVAVSDVLSRHPEAVVESTKPSNPPFQIYQSPGNGSGNGSFHPMFTDLALSNLGAQITQNASAASEFNRAMEKYHGEQIKAAAEHYNQTGDPAQFRDAIEAQSRTNGFMSGAGGRLLRHVADKNDEEKDNKNKTRKQIVQLVFSQVPYIGGLVSVLMGINDPQDYKVSTGSAGAKAESDFNNKVFAYDSQTITMETIRSGILSPEQLVSIRNSSPNGSAVQKLIDEQGNVAAKGSASETKEALASIQDSVDKELTKKDPSLKGITANSSGSPYNTGRNAAKGTPSGQWAINSDNPKDGNNASDS